MFKSERLRYWEERFTDFGKLELLDIIIDMLTHYHLPVNDSQVHYVYKFKRMLIINAIDVNYNHDKLEKFSYFIDNSIYSVFMSIHGIDSNFIQVIENVIMDSFEILNIDINTIHECVLLRMLPSKLNLLDELKNIIK